MVVWAPCSPLQGPPTEPPHPACLRDPRAAAAGARWGLWESPACSKAGAGSEELLSQMAPGPLPWAPRLVLNPRSPPMSPLPGSPPHSLPQALPFSDASPCPACPRCPTAPQALRWGGQGGAQGSPLPGMGVAPRKGKGRVGFPLLALDTSKGTGTGQGQGVSPIQLDSGGGHEHRGVWRKEQGAGMDDSSLSSLNSSSLEGAWQAGSSLQHRLINPQRFITYFFCPLLLSLPLPPSHHSPVSCTAPLLPDIFTSEQLPPSGKIRT